jgi:hypothetical protein
MNAFRTTRMFALIGLLTLVVLGLGAATADAGCHGSYGFGSSYCNYSPSYCNYGSSYCYTPSYCNYDYSCFYPTTCSYPVTVYDCFGRPYVVWKTGYNSVPATYLP